MTTRTVSLTQITAGPIDAARWPVRLKSGSDQNWHSLRIRCRAVADAAGGDVFEPINSLEAALVEALRLANWPHPVHVEVME